jgi:hypothetical protein
MYYRHCQPHLPRLQRVDNLDIKYPEDLRDDFVNLHGCNIPSGAHHRTLRKYMLAENLIFRQG